MAGPAMTPAARPAPTMPLDTGHVQGLVLQGYGRLRAAAYLLLTVRDGTPPDRAQAWLREVLPELTFGEARPAGHAANLALTAAGLARFGLPEPVMAGFAPEFREGMTSTHRSRLLGDVGAAAPEQWAWGGPAGDAVHALLALFAEDDAALEPVLRRHRALAGAHGLQVPTVLDTTDLGVREHFGFRDGLSQPVIAGSARAAGPDVAPRDLLRAGEFVLGHPNEHGQLPRSPALPAADDPAHRLPPHPTEPRSGDFGRDGSYLVVRTLAQDVPAFWRFLDGATRRQDGSQDPEARTALAARMVGRWPGGAPLTLSPDGDDPAHGNANDFAYHAQDAAGLRCPLGAHVRRANPRDALPPKPGEAGSVAVNKRHRLLRRGRPYGAPLSVEQALVADGAGQDERGLHFLAVCADLARQFEFVMHTWVLNPHFAGLLDDADPVLGGQDGATGTTFTRQARPVRRRVHDVPAFVTVRGGAYFFLPGRRALHVLADLDGPRDERAGQAVGSAASRAAASPVRVGPSGPSTRTVA